MSLRLVALLAFAGWSLACSGGVSPERCQQWDASVREVVANVENALPADVKRRSFGEDYDFVAKDLELTARLAECVAQGHLAMEAPDATESDPPSDIAFVDALAFGAGSKPSVAAMEAAGWSCQAAAPPAGFDGKAQVCSGTYAKGKADVQLAFRSGRLARVSLAVRDIPKRIEDIVAKTDADVFAARKALIEKVVDDLATRFDDLTQTEDEVENGRIRMVWTGSDGSLRARLEFAQRGPSLGFAIQDEAVVREVAQAREDRPAKKAESYFE